MKTTWLHIQFVLIFFTGLSQVESALTVKFVILKPLKDSTSSVLHNFLPQNCTNVITGGAMNQKSPWVIDQILHCVTILLWIFIAYILVWHPHQKEK